MTTESAFTLPQSGFTVQVIPATKPRNLGEPQVQRELRVAAYCRVSTGDESQQRSYSNQRAFYSSIIQNRPGWTFAGIYADEARSGTNRLHRKEFNRMMEDAKAGKIDYIMTKSISRFARNTIDTLDCVRQLQQLSPPVGIVFEKENIDTLGAAGELILTILSALAQEESRSLSDNIRWTFQKNFQAGKPQINLQRMLGYDKGEQGAWLINEDQARTVRFLFQQFLQGQSANAIAKAANAQGLLTVNGKGWRADSVLDVLRNEKYVGDLEMQKTITKDFLTHRACVNRGEAPKYYVRDHHKAIIDRFTWEKTQLILQAQKASRPASSQRGALASPFGNLRCETCGEPLRRTNASAVARGYQDQRSQGLDPSTQSETYSFRYPVWHCCGTALTECALEQSFMELLYSLKRQLQTQGERAALLRDFRSLDATAQQQEAFRLFVRCLLALPERSAAGQPLHIHGLDSAPWDLLPFDRGLYCAFVRGGRVLGERALYEMSFGLSLCSLGAERRLEDFVGFRRSRPDGSWELLLQPWQVNGRAVGYRRQTRR